MTIRVEYAPNVPIAEVEVLWRDLEPRARLSFFLSWTWIGCWLRSSGLMPNLLIARRQTRLVGLALLVRPSSRRGRLVLLASGDPKFDCPFVEYNGFLIAEDCPEAASIMLEALADAPLFGGSDTAWRRLELPGIDDTLRAQIASAGMGIARDVVRPAPWIDLARLRQSGMGYLESRSRNTRAQIRRTLRAFEAAGPIGFERAEGLQAAITGLDALERLHQASWTARGKPGAFATPFFGAFHRRLITEAWPAGQVDLLRVTAGERTVGWLYNFVHGGLVYSYQSGFDYGWGRPHRPGLACHALAIEHYLSTGFNRYLFLAGDARYKTSLSTDSEPLHWLTVRRPRIFAKLFPQ